MYHRKLRMPFYITWTFLDNLKDKNLFYGKSMNQDICKSDILALSKTLKHFRVTDTSTFMIWLDDKQHFNFQIQFWFDPKTFKIANRIIGVYGKDRTYSEDATPEQLFQVLTPEQKEEIVFHLDIFA